MAKLNHNGIRMLARCALFTALIAIGAFLRIPTPLVPITLQTLFVMLAGMLLGPKYAALSVLCYIALGLMGVPVFAAGGGISYVLKPSFGYIIGFAVGAFLTGVITRKREAPSFLRLMCAGLAGLLVIYVIGVLYYWAVSALYLGTAISARTLLVYCFLLTLPGDILLCVLASLLCRRLIPILNKRSDA